MSFQVFDYKDIFYTFGNFDDTTSNVTTLMFLRTVDAFAIDSLVLTSDDSVDQLVALVADLATPLDLLTFIKVPAGSGTDGTHPAVDALAALPANFQRLMAAKNQGWSIFCAGPVSSGKHIWWFGQGGIF